MIPIEIDLLIEAGDWRPQDELRALAARAVDAALVEIAARPLQPPPELSLVFTDDVHMRTLNAGWRGKDKPTNVLSFPAFPTKIGQPLPPMLGDIVLAFETVEREARDEGKALGDHMTHLIVHGVLHLLGYDHEIHADAEIMEAIERRVLARLAIADPYA